MPRPEETFHAIALCPGDDVNMQMGNTLTYLIVHGYKRTFRADSFFNGATN